MSAEQEWPPLLADLVTICWRLHRRLEPEPNPTGDPLARIRRDLRALWDRLAQAGVEVRDHTGEPYDPGQGLRVLAFQADAGVPRPQVLETVKPTIYYREQWLQLGEVIVGTPASPGATDPRPPAEEP